MWWTYPETVGLGQADAAACAASGGFWDEEIRVCVPESIGEPSQGYAHPAGPQESFQSSLQSSRITSWLEKNQNLIAAGIGAFAFLLLLIGRRR
jgi:hypothetical protein